MSSGRERVNETETVICVTIARQMWPRHSSNVYKGAEIQYLSEVLKLIEAAQRRNPEMAQRYALHLASKLDEAGENKQAGRIRQQLQNVPSTNIQAMAVSSKVPVDEESRLDTVDLKWIQSVEKIFVAPALQSSVESFVRDVQNYDLWASKGVATPSRLLLSGPPGTGKTLLASSIAHILGLPLITTRSDSLVSSLLGQTSRNIRQVFDYAQAQPCVLFLDEFDALAKSRADSREVGELQRVVIALLQNLDAAPPETIVIAATNHEELLDVAVWRRFPRVLHVALPGDPERLELWKEHLEWVTLSARELSILADYSKGLSGSDIKQIALECTRESITRGDPAFEAAFVMRAIARRVWYDKHEILRNAHSEMEELRRWAPSVFTVRALAHVFSVSTRQVIKATREVEDAGSGLDSPASV